MSLHPHRVRKNHWRKIKRDIGLLEGQKARYAKYPRGQGWRTGHENPWHFSRENLYGLTSLNPNHKKGIALIILLSLGILFLTDQALKNTATGKSPVDPAKPLWYDPLQSSSGWLCFGPSAGYNAGGPGLANFSFTPNAVNSGLCIDQSPIALSEANSHVLDIPITVQWVPGGGTIFPDFGFFLTRNNTLPTQTANWDPENGGGCGGCADKNVAFFYRVTSSPNNAQTTKQVYHIYTQRDPTQTILSGDFQCNTSTVFFCSDSTGYVGGGNLNWIPGTRWWYQVMLNFTGQNSNGGATSTIYTVSSYAPGFNTIIWGTPGTTRSQPWLDTTSKYYFGIWEQSLANAKTLEFQGSPDPINGSPLAGTCIGNYPTCTPDSLSAYIYIPTVQAPTLDTGGFFGPIIRALISLGVFMLNAALQFVAFITPGLTAGFSFLESFYTTLIDVIGNLIWPGSNLGTALASMLSAILNFMVNVVPPALGNVVAIFSRYVDGASVLLTWGAIPLKIALNVLLVGINTISFAINLISMLTKIWGVLLFTMLVIFYFGDVGDYGLSGFQAWFETVKWLVFGLGIRPLFMILDYMIDIITAIIGFIPKPFVQMVAHKFPRLPIVDITGNPTWPSFELDELRRGNIFSVGGFLIGTVALVWYETTSLPGSITALVPGVGTTLTNLNGLTNLSLLFVELFGFCVIFLLPGKMIHAVTGLAVNPPWGENLAFQRGGRSVSVRGTSIRVQRKPKKHFQARLEKRVAKLKGTMSEKQKEEAVSKAFAEAAKKQQAQVEVQKARETGERIAKEELKRREDERQRQERIAQVGE